MRKNKRRETSGLTRTRTRRNSLRFELLEDRRLLTGTLELVKDINTTAVDSSPESYTALGNKVIFTAINAGVGSRALMVTDGTQDGTGFLSTFPQQFNSNPANPTNLVALGSHVYFSATESTASLGNQNRELWRTDGTFAGTSRIADLQSGSVGSNPDFLTVAGGNLYFAATVTASGTELFKFDPSTGVASLVTEIVAGTGSSSPTNLVALGNSVYFVASNGTGLGFSIWKSDGTASGTVAVSPQFTAAPNRLTVVGDKLYYVAADTTVGTELWVVEGNTSTPINIRTGANSSSPTALKNLDGILYFVASDGVTGFELYRTAGSLATTERLTDLGAGALDGLSSSLPAESIGKVGTSVVFQIIRPFNNELGFYSLSTGVTTVKDIAEGAFVSSPHSFTTIGSYAYFSAGTQLGGTELWKTDGTASGTTMVSDLLPGAASSGPFPLVAIGNELYFRAFGPVIGQQTHILNTTSGTIRPIISWPNIASSVNRIKANNNIAYFSATDGTSGFEPWRSDGTAAGTFRLVDINTTGSSSPSSFVGAGAMTFFIATQPSTGAELWKTDGTVAGTSLVKDINPTASTGSSITMMTPVGNRVYFMANDGLNGNELWVSDGTADGTQMVVNQTAGNTSSNMNLLGQANGKLLFTFNDTTLGKGVELWASGGTAATTGLVKDIYQGTSQSGINGGGVTIGQYHYFAATSAETGRELWRTDGTEAGTTLVADIQIGVGWSSPSWLAAGGTKLYFTASHTSSGNEIWVYDIATQAAPQVVDYVTGTGGLTPTLLMATSNQVFFASSYSNGSELWRSDGTTAGTYLVKDINPGALSGLAGSAFDGTLGNRIFFPATNGVDGLELWTSDGTSQGTNMVSNPFGSPDSYYSTQGLASIGNSVLFGQVIAMHGHELVKFTPQAPNDPPTDIAMSGGNVAENSPVSTTAATFSSIDPNAGNTFTYSLVAGSGDIDNASFSITGNTLRTNAVFNFESKSSYSIRVRTTDQGGLQFEKAFTITVADVDESPGDIFISNNLIPENSPANATIGTLSATRSDPLATSFALVPGDLDNSRFALVGNTLQVKDPLDYESTSYYVVRVSATSAGVTITRDFSIFVGPVNEFDPQLNLLLAFSVPENSLAVVNLEATDSDSPQPTFAYTVGGPDASKFTTVGNRLSFIAAPNFEVPTDVGANNEYLVQLTVSDGSRSHTRDLTIVVTDVNEAPVGIALSNLSIAESLPAGSIVGTLTATDLDGPNPISFAFSSITPNDNTDFEIVGNEVRTRRQFDFETPADQQLTLRLVARDGLLATSLPTSFNLSVTDAPERPIANSQSLSTTKNNAGLPISLSGSGTGALTYAISSQPAHGTLTGTAPNFTYKPASNFVGTDSFFFTVSDASLTSFQARVEISVVGTKPIVQFVASTIDASEGSFIEYLGIQLSEAAEVGFWIQIQHNQASSTAIVGSDFSPTSTSVFVPAGSTFTSLPLSITEDSSDEPNETAIFQIGTSSEYNVGSTNLYTVTIIDNDLPPTLSLSSNSLVRNESTQTFGTNLLLSTPLPTSVTVNLTVSGSATAGTDYTNSIPTSVTIPAGQQSVFVPITLLQDTSAENSETIILAFDGSSSLWPANTTLASRTFTLTVTDDDQRVVNMGQSFTSVSENRGSLVLKATMAPAPTTLTRVPFVFSGAAQLGGTLGDYSIPFPLEFVFGVGNTEATIVATIIDDTRIETPPESFTLKLAAGPNYVLGQNTQTTVNIIDNDKARLSFEVSEISRWEGDPVFSVVARLDRSLGSSLTVPIVVSSGQGEAYASASDYSLSGTSFAFGPNDVSSSRNFTIVADSITELTETLTIAFADSVFSSNSLVVPGSNRTTRIKIQDNDPLVSVSADASSVKEGGTAIYTFSLTAPTNVPVNIPFTLSGTAKANVNYAPLNYSSITIPAGQRSAKLSITASENQTDNALDPTLTVTLGSVAGATVDAKAKAATTSIIDNDQAFVDFPSGDKAIFDLNEGRVWDRAGLVNRTLNVNVSMTKFSDKDIDLTLSFSGRATRDSDYKINGLTNGKLRIPAGRTSASLVLEIKHDTVYEGNETLFITIDSVSSGASLPKGAKPVRQFGIIEDDKQAVTKPQTTATSSAPGTLILDVQSGGGVTTKSTGKSSSSSKSSSNNGIVYKPGDVAIFTGNQGPIQGAVAYFDSNFNLIADLSEPSSPTALDGSFSLDLTGFDTDQDEVIEPSEGRLVLSGGTDLASGLAWRIPLTAPSGLFNITPISTLVESLTRLEPTPLTLQDAIEDTTRALGISSYNLLESNSLYEILEKDALSARAYNTHTQLYSTVISVAQLLAGKSSRSLDTLGLVVFDEIAKLIARNSDTVLDFTQQSIIEGIIRTTAASQSIEGLADAVIESVAKVISGATSRLAAISLTESISGHQYLLSLNKVKTVSQGAMPDAIYALGAGTKTIIEFENAFIGAELDAKIAAVDSRISVPPVIGISSLSLVENNASQSMMRFRVEVKGDHDYEISTGFFSVDGSATAGDDYNSVSGTLTWAAGDNGAKFIDVPIIGDTNFETDEYFKVLLANPSMLVIRVDEGYGFILNDEANAIVTSNATTSNSILYSLSDSEASLRENGVERVQGEFARPLSTTFQGQDGIADQLTLDFSANTFRADTLSFHGGTGQDTFTALAGRFERIDYAVGIPEASTVSFKPVNSTLSPTVMLNGIEGATVNVSEVGTLVLNVASGITSLVIEDADPNSTGSMRIRSATNAFAPIEFTNPTTSIRIVRASANTTVTQLSRDSAFTGTIDLGFTDVTRPVSAVNAMPARATSLQIPVSVTGSDPAGTEGSPTGVKEYDLYVAQDSGPFTKFATVPASAASTTFNATSNHTYFFRSVARDNAGNEELEPSLIPDAMIRTGDLDKPVTSVISAETYALGRFSVVMLGTDSGGSGLARFDLFVSVDNATPVLVGSASGGTASNGNYTGNFEYQGISDGVQHTYRFFSVGVDTAGNVESAPIGGADDIVRTRTFTAPTTLTATGITVQQGAKQRSFIQTVDVAFTSAATLASWFEPRYVQIQKFGIDATDLSTGATPVSLNSLSINGNQLRIDFGANGLGGSKTTIAGDGYYRIQLDINKDGNFDDGAQFDFFRLLGDANGDGGVNVDQNGVFNTLDTAVVDSLMGRIGANLDGDLNGSGNVNVTDKSYTTRQRGRRIAVLGPT